MSDPFRNIENDPDYDIPVIVYPEDTVFEDNYGQVRLVRAMEPVYTNRRLVADVVERAGCRSFSSRKAFGLFESHVLSPYRMYSSTPVKGERITCDRAGRSRASFVLSDKRQNRKVRSRKNAIRYNR